MSRRKNNQRAMSDISLKDDVGAMRFRQHRPHSATCHQAGLGRDHTRIARRYGTKSPDRRDLRKLSGLARPDQATSVATDVGILWAEWRATVDRDGRPIPFRSAACHAFRSPTLQRLDRTGHGAHGGGDRCVFGIERMYYDKVRRCAVCGRSWHSPFLFELEWENVCQAGRPCPREHRP
jgi:hypothetical protein